MQKQVRSSPFHLELQSLQEMKWNYSVIKCSNIKWLQHQKLQTCWRSWARILHLLQMSSKLVGVLSGFIVSYFFVMLGLLPDKCIRLRDFLNKQRLTPPCRTTSTSWPVNSPPPNTCCHKSSVLALNWEQKIITLGHTVLLHMYYLLNISNFSVQKNLDMLRSLQTKVVRKRV